MQQVHKINTE